MGRSASRPGGTKKRKPGAEISNVSRAPQDRERAEAAAYLRLIGATQKQAAKGVGIALRTLQGWEASPWWPDAEDACRKRWMQAGTSAAMRTLLRSMDKGDDAATARWWAERCIPAFAPPKQRHEVRFVGMIVSVESLKELTIDELHVLRAVVARVGQSTGTADDLAD